MWKSCMCHVVFWACVHPQIINVYALLSWLCDACFNRNRYLIRYETCHLPFFLMVTFGSDSERNSDLTQFRSQRMRLIDMTSKCTATVAELWVLYD